MYAEIRDGECAFIAVDVAVVTTAKLGEVPAGAAVEESEPPALPAGAAVPTVSGVMPTSVFVP